MRMWQGKALDCSFNAFSSRLYFLSFKMYECNARCLASLGLDPSVARHPLWLSGLPLSFHPPAKISKAVTALAACICDWRNCHSWPSLILVSKSENLSSPGSSSRLLDSPFSGPSFGLSPWVVSSLLLPINGVASSHLLSENDSQLCVSNLRFLLNSVSVLPFLPQSSLLARKDHHCVSTQAKTLITPFLTFHIQPNCKALLVLSLKCVGDVLTSVSPSPPPSTLSRSPSPTGGLQCPPYPPLHFPSSPTTCSPEKTPVVYEFIHRYLLCLITTVSPPSSSVPRTLEGAQQIIKK